MVNQSAVNSPQDVRQSKKRNIVSGVLFGIGFMALVDEIIFHQLLQWHHFYDHATTQAGIFSDGLLNSFALFAIVFGLFMFADLRKKNGVYVQRLVASLLLGAGGFQLFDGLINHKVFRIHQVRNDVDNLLPYDIAWNGSAVILLIVGTVLLVKSRKKD